MTAGEKEEEGKEQGKGAPEKKKPAFLKYFLLTSGYSYGYMATETVTLLGLSVFLNFLA